jgi:lipid-A-disaccharide synthase-like uncharacterized protein
MLKKGEKIMESSANSAGFWKSKSRLSQVIFILSLLYYAGSVIVLFLALGLMPNMSRVYLNPYLLIGFSIVSFVLTLFISVYHLALLLKRRKRKTDRQ